MTAIRTPTIHLNGTGAQDLEESYLAQLKAVNAAIDTLAANPPSGRDYYVQGDNAIQEAIDQHSNRRKMLVDISQELQTILISIADQIELRERQRRK